MPPQSVRSWWERSSPDHGFSRLASAAHRGGRLVHRLVDHVVANRALEQSIDVWVWDALGEGGTHPRADPARVPALPSHRSLRRGALPTDPSLGGWTYNGGTLQQGSTLQLTDATASPEAGTAFWPNPVTAAGLTTSFTSSIGSGSGADGMTLTLADPSAGASALGLSGHGLGYSGIDGVAVALGTFPNDQIGIAQGENSDGSPHWIDEVPSPVPLRQGTHRVEVTVSAGVLSVSVDGSQVVAAPVALPPQVLMGFTAANGGLTDVHAVTNVVVTGR